MIVQQLYGLILIVVGLLGINIFIIKHQKLNQRIKLWLTVSITSICYIITLIVDINAV